MLTTDHAVQVSPPGRREVVSRQRPMTRPVKDSPSDVETRPHSREVELLERVRDRTDAAAWSAFVAEYQPVLRAFVRRHGVKAADVPDVVQDVLARLVPALARFEFDPSRGRFLTWLWRVTGNAAKNWISKQITRTRLEAAWHRQQPVTETGTDAPDERERARLRQTLDRVFAAVRRTTRPAAWACFEGQVLHGRPADELAAELGVSSNAVFVNTCRIRARVREQCLRYPIHAEWFDR